MISKFFTFLCKLIYYNLMKCQIGKVQHLMSSIFKKIHLWCTSDNQGYRKLLNCFSYTLSNVYYATQQTLYSNIFNSDRICLHIVWMYLGLLALIDIHRGFWSSVCCSSVDLVNCVLTFPFFAFLTQLFLSNRISFTDAGLTSSMNSAFHWQGHSGCVFLV